MSGPDREGQVGQAFVALADTLVEDYDIVDLLDQLAERYVSLLAADAAGNLLGDARKRLQVVASSSEDAQIMGLLQRQADQGPCLDCFQGVSQVRVPDLAEADAVERWTAFVAAVERSGGLRSGARGSAAARGGDRGDEPVPPRTRRAARSGPGVGAGAGRCGHDRDLVQAGDPPW